MAGVKSAFLQTVVMREMYMPCPRVRVRCEQQTYGFSLWMNMYWLILTQNSKQTQVSALESFTGRGPAGAAASYA